MWHGPLWSSLFDIAIYHAGFFQIADLMRCRKKNIIENDDRFANYIDWSNIDYALLISFWVFWRALCSASTSTSAIPTNAKPSSAMVTHWRGTRSTLQWCSLFTSSLSFVAIHRVVKVKTNGPLKAAKTITKIYFIVWYFAVMANSGMLGLCRKNCRYIASVFEWDASLNRFKRFMEIMEISFSAWNCEIENNNQNGCGESFVCSNTNEQINQFRIRQNLGGFHKFVILLFSCLVLACCRFV